jgi:hypothetical protein
MRAGSTLTALQYLLKSVSLADTHHLHSSKVSATLLLAEVQLQLGHTQKAVNLLHSIHPQLYLHSPLYAQIKATLLQSKCMLARTAPSEGTNHSCNLTHSPSSSQQQVVDSCGSSKESRERRGNTAECRAIEGELLPAGSGVSFTQLYQGA